MKKRNLILIILPVIVLGITLTSCSKKSENEITVPGVVDGDIITLKAAVAGTIQNMTIKEGDKVSRDQLLVQINPDKVENQLKELELNMNDIKINSEKINKKMVFQRSDIAQLKKQVERFQRLKAKNAIPGENLENMQLKLLQSETALFDSSRSIDALANQEKQLKNKQDYLRILLNDHTIKSPVDGFVIEKFISQGEQVFPASAIADILDLSSIHIEIFVEEGEMGRLKLNQEAKIRVDGLKDSSLKGSIYYFGKKAEFSPKYIVSEKERKALLYEIKIKVQDPEGILKIGMPVTVIL